MRNLKKMLSLVMALAMVASFMVVGASAAEFSDAKDIKNVDAVNTLVALGVIKGYDTGDFKPEGTVTRAEMAKMICVALNGGRDPQLGSATTVYTDVPANHWAAGYIAFCTNLKLVAGQGNNIFAPDATVTGSQAAKMLLVALGYDVEFSGLTGVNWEINTNVTANKNDLYANLGSLNPSVGLTRDNAAQMIYNALDAKVVELSNGAYKTSQYSYTGTETVQTGTERVYKMTVKVPGALSAFAAALDNSVYASYADADAAAKLYAPAAVITTDYTLVQTTQPVYGTNKVTKNADETLGHLYLTLITDGDSILTGVQKDSKGTYSLYTDLGTTPTYTKVAADYSNFMGQKVKVLFKDTDDVYGVYASTESAVIASGVIDDISISGTTLKIDGTVYKTDEAFASTPVYAFNDFATTTMLNALPGNKAADITAIDNNDNGKIDLLVYKPFTAEKVTYVGKTSVTLNVNGANDFEDINYYEGIAKNDWVKVIAAVNTVDDTLTVEKMEVLSGAIEATRSGEAKIGGTWYTLATGVSALDLDSEYDVAVAGGYIFHAEKTSGSSTLSDVVFVSESVAPEFGTAKTKLHFADGTSKLIDVSKVGNADVSALVPTGMYTYKIKSGNYELTAVDASNKAGADGYDAAAGAYADKRIGSYYIADDAAIYVKHTNTTPNPDTVSYKVYTGEQAKKWGATPYGATVALYSTVNGLKTVKAAFITASVAGDIPSATGESVYGYVTSKPETVKQGEDLFASYTLWTANGTINVLDEDNDLTIAKGDVVTYDDLGNGKIKNVATTGTAVAISGKNGDNLGIHNASGALNAVAAMDKDTVVLYVDSSKKAGAEGGEIQPAIMQADGSYILNAWVVAGTSGRSTKADLIVFDVNNDIDSLANGAAAGRAGYAITPATITSEAGYTVATDKTYASQGDIVTVTVTVTAAGATKSITAGVSGTGASVSTPAASHTTGTATTYTFEIVVGTADPVITITLA